FRRVAGECPTPRSWSDRSRFAEEKETAVAPEKLVRVARAARGLLALLLVPVVAGSPAARAEVYPHLQLGNPSKATANEEKKDNFLLKKKYFAVSYNNSKGIPNWVSWLLTKDDLGTAPRKRAFDPDVTLPSGF